MTIEISTIEYDAVGNPIGSISSINFGELAPSETSPAKAIRLNVSNAQSIESIRLGIIASSTQGVDISTIFRIGHSQDFDDAFVPSEFFPGINDTKTPENLNNVSVGTDVSGLMSDYVYLSAVCPPRYLESGECVYRWYFDYTP